MQVHTIGIDLAKNVFQVLGVGELDRCIQAQHRASDVSRRLESIPCNRRSNDPSLKRLICSVAAA